MIRAANPNDADAIWRVIEPVLRAGETYAFDRDWSREDALASIEELRGQTRSN